MNNSRRQAFSMTVAALLVFLALRFLFGPGADLVTLVGAILIAAAGTLLYRRSSSTTAAADPGALIPDPPLATLLFNSVRSAPIWFGIRIFVGLDWLEAGYHKFSGTGWLDGGSSLQGYWTRAVTIPPSGKAVISYDWYSGFLQYMLNNGWYTWFAYVITFGEMLVGIGLILGALVGIAAFFGALMNMSFLLAGSSSSNPILLTLAFLLVMAWKVAGWYGLDRFLLPALGAPWSPGWMVRRVPPAAPSTG